MSLPAVSHHRSGTVITIKQESLSFIRHRSVCLLYVCLQEGGGARDFSIYVAGIKHRPVLLNTLMSLTVGSRDSVSFNTQARSQMHHAAERDTCVNIEGLLSSLGVLMVYISQSTHLDGNHDSGSSEHQIGQRPSACLSAKK